MKIAGLEKCSLVDYPGKLAAVVFLPGCNLDCHFCHNRWLLQPHSSIETLSRDNVLESLKRRQGFLDAVVISGGEPTLQPRLPELLRELRELDYLTKLDTNGTRPDMLEALLDEDLLDYVAMDVKAPREKYAEVVGSDVDVSAIDASIALLKSGQTDYEFRTTVLPEFAKSDLLEIGAWVQGARRLVLQQYRPAQFMGAPILTARPPHPAAWIRETVQELAAYVDHCTTRGVDSGDRMSTAGPLHAPTILN